MNKKKITILIASSVLFLLSLSACESNFFSSTSPEPSSPAELTAEDATGVALIQTVDAKSTLLAITLTQQARQTDTPTSRPDPTATWTPMPPIYGEIGTPLVSGSLVFTIPEIKLDSGMLFVPMTIENKGSESFDVRQLWSGCAVNLPGGEKLAADPAHPFARIGPGTLLPGIITKAPELVFAFSYSKPELPAQTQFQCRVNEPDPVGGLIVKDLYWYFKK